MSAPVETEVKAVVPNPDALRKRMLAAGAKPGYHGLMRDVRYDRRGEFRDRGEVVRLRVLGDRRWFLGWKGVPSVAAGGLKAREEVEAGGDAGAERAGALLARLGFEPVEVIERWVEYWRLHDADVRLEIYPRMDALVEVEGDLEAIERATAATGLPRDAFTPESLPEFLRRYTERTGTPAALEARLVPPAEMPWSGEP